MAVNIKHRIDTMKFLKSKIARKLRPRILWLLHRYMENEKLSYLDNKIIINSYQPSFPSESFERYIKSINALSRDGKIIPQVLIMSLTDNCPYNCYHCSNEYSKEKTNLSTEELKTIIRAFIDAGVFKIGFSGGEPFTRGDIEELTKLASPDCQVMVNTTGFNSNLQKLKDLKDAGLMGVRISLDHYDKDKFDRMRGYEGAFDIAVNCIKDSLNAGLYTSVAFVPTRETAQPEKIGKFIDFVESLGAHEITIFEPKPAGKMLDCPTDTFLNHEERKYLSELQKRINKDSNKKIKVLSFLYLEGKEMLGCTGGSLNFYTDADGSVFPCLFYPFSLGNVLKEPLSGILDRSYKIFKHPKKYCLAFEGKNIIREKLDKEELIKLSNEFQELPDFYKKLMKR